MTDSISDAGEVLHRATPMQARWVAPWMSMLTAAGVAYAFGLGTTGAVHAVYVLASMTVFAWLIFLAGRSQRLRLFSLLNWVGGLTGSVVLVLITPHMLPISLMAVITCVIWAVTISRPDRRILYVGSILTACALVGISIVIREALLGTPIIPPLITGIEADALLFTLFVTYGAIILQQILRFRDRIESTVVDLRNANRGLRATERELRRRVTELTQLLEMSRAVSSTMNLPSLLERTIAQILPVVHYDRATVMLLRDQQLVDLYSHGITKNRYIDAFANFLRDKSNHEFTVSLKQPAVFTDLSKLIPGTSGSLMAVPLIVRGKFIGLMTLRCEQTYFYSQHDADLCMAFANQVAGMIDSAQLQDAAASAMVVAERHRLARELHDSISQSLFGIVLGTRTAQEQLSSSPDAARTALDYSVSLASAALADMRALIFTLRPETLERKGLLAALQAQIDLLQPHHPTRILLDAPDGEPSASLDVKEALYRIAAEALQNSLRHSSASSVSLRIASSPSLRLDVVDDGVGFDPTASHDGHLGLKSMRERADFICASLSVLSAPGRGTHISLELPMQNTRFWEGSPAKVDS